MRAYLRRSSAWYKAFAIECITLGDASLRQCFERAVRKGKTPWLRGPMDKASAHGAGDCRFESCRGQLPTCAMMGSKHIQNTTITSLTTKCPIQEQVPEHPSAKHRRSDCNAGVSACDPLSVPRKPPPRDAQASNTHASTKLQGAQRLQLRSNALAIAFACKRTNTRLQSTI